MQKQSQPQTTNNPKERDTSVQIRGRRHTKGPWDNTPAENQGRWISTDEGPIAKVFGDGEESKANAQLIAAAPELLEIAENILANDLLPYLPAEYIVKVRAAIKKAKGE